MKEKIRQAVESYIADYGDSGEVRDEHEKLCGFVDTIRKYMEKQDKNYFLSSEEFLDKVERRLQRIPATEAERDLIFDCAYLLLLKF